MKFLAVVYLLASFSHCFAKTCKKLSECVELGSELTGQKIIFNKKILPLSYELSHTLEMNKDNARQVLSEALNIFGLARIPTQVKGTFRLIDARDIRFHSDLPHYEASKTHVPKIPQTHDPIRVTYKGVKGAGVEIISENVKMFLSRYGRIKAMRDGTILIIDIASHVREVLPLIQKQDFPLTNDERREIELEKKRAHDLEIARLKAGEMHEIGPHKKHKEH